MKRPVLFVHGAGAHDEDERLAASLRSALGDGYEVRYPKMPNENSPEYGAWKERVSEEISGMDGGVILAGHSFGASVLLKYLSEESPPKPVAGVFLVATPYWGAADWEKKYALRDGFASRLPEGVPIFFYHGRDDEIVPFGHLARYEEKLPRATFRGFDNLGHQFGDDLSEVAGDIVGLRQEIDLPREIGKPARRALVGAGYPRLDLLTGVREAEVLELHGMGPKALERLRDALDARGLSFAGGKDRTSEEWG